MFLPRIGRPIRPPSGCSSSIDSLQSPFTVSVPANVRKDQGQQSTSRHRPSSRLWNSRHYKAGRTDVHDVVRSANCPARRIEVISQPDKTVAERSASEVFGEREVIENTERQGVRTCRERRHHQSRVVARRRGIAGWTNAVVVRVQKGGSGAGSVEQRDIAIKSSGENY